MEASCLSIPTLTQITYTSSQPKPSDTPTFPFCEHNDSCLAREHFDGDTQYTRQQLLQIELLYEGAGYFKQVVALSDAEIGEHISKFYLRMFAKCKRNRGRLELGGNSAKGSS
jgi:hypothetical protein